MRIKAKNIRAGDRVTIGGRSFDVDLTGPTGEVRGTCLIFEAGQARGISLPLDQDVEVSRPDRSAATAATSPAAAPVAPRAPEPERPSLLVPGSHLLRGERVIGHIRVGCRRGEITVMPGYGVSWGSTLPSTNGDPRHIADLAARRSAIIAHERREGASDFDLSVEIDGRDIGDLPFEEALAVILKAADLPVDVGFWRDLNFDLGASARQDRKATARQEPPAAS